MKIVCYCFSIYVSVQNVNRTSYIPQRVRNINFVKGIFNKYVVYYISFKKTESQGVRTPDSWHPGCNSRGK